MSPILALIIANIIWGAASPIFKYSLENIPPFTLLFLRFFLASLIFFPFVKGFNPGSIRKKDWLLLLSGIIFGFTIHIGTLFIGLQKTNSINAPVIVSSAPLFLFLGSWLFLREKPRRKVFLGMIISFIGVMMIIFAPLLASINTGKLDFDGEITGNFLYFISTIAYVISILLLKPVSEKIKPLQMTFFSFFIAAVTFLPFSLIELQSWSFSQLTVPGIVGIVYGLFFSSALAYFLYFFGISKISAQEVGIFAYADPVVAILVAAPLLHEYPDKFFIVGALLVFGGIYVSEGRIHYHPFHKLFQKAV